MPSGPIPWSSSRRWSSSSLAAWALRTIISERSARYFLVENAQAEALTGWLYLSPNLLGFLAFFAGPLVFSMVISFYDWDGISQAVYVGLDNYIETLSLTVAGSAASLPPGYSEVFTLPFSDLVVGGTDPLFWKSMANIFLFMLVAIPAAVLSALFLAVMINAGYRGTKAFRTVFFVPAVAGVIGVTLIWKQMFNAAVGFINWGIATGGQVVNVVLPGDPFSDRVEIGWLSDPNIALLAVCIVFVWSQFGFNTVLFTAGLQGIGRDLYEAAELDGCNAWQQFRHVTVPQLKETTFFVTVTTVILALQLFDIVYALNQPNPVGIPGQRHPDAGRLHLPARVPAGLLRAGQRRGVGALRDHLHLHPRPIPSPACRCGGEVMPRSGRPVRGWRAQFARIFVYASLTIAGLVVLIPFLFALSGSMKTPEDVFTYPPRILPHVAATATVNGEELPVFTVPLPGGGRRTLRGWRTARAFASSARSTIPSSYW